MPRSTTSEALPPWAPPSSTRIAMFLEGSKFQTCASEDLKKHIDAAGVDKTILCSDLGQVGNISPVEGLRRGIRLCMDLGYADEDIRKMVSLNTARTLGIEADLPARGGR